MKTIKKPRRIKSINQKNNIQKSKELSEKQIALLLGAEVDEFSGKVKKDKNWICNFH